jgi:hypothetical protein
MGTIKKAQMGMRVGRSGGRSCGIEKQIRKDERQAARENRQADRQARREERRAPKMRSGGKTPAWTRSEGKDPKGGLNRKGVASYRRENPGSKLKMAVTTPPSKLKKGSKAANRRKSFCARMSGVKGPMRKPNGKPTRKALALRKWNC